MHADFDFQLLFEESPDVLLVLLPDAPRFTMVAATKARWRATHTTPETLGKGLFEVFPDNPDDSDATGTRNLRASLERVLQTKQPDTMPVQKYDIRAPDGGFEVRYWSPKNLPILSPSGEVIYILHRVEDVTELVRASELGDELRDKQRTMEREVIQRSRELAGALLEVRAANAKLAELDSAKTAFFNNISHEFRTPLTLMLGPLEDELAESARAPQPARVERLTLAHRNSLRLLKLVNGLLEFARLEAGRLQSTFQPTDLSRLTAEIASNFDSALQRAGLSLTTDCPPLPESMYVDRDMWEKIVLNLLSNAFKHTFEGGITVRTRWLGTAAEVTVEDTGIGISAAEIPRLFERFHRVKGAASRTLEGTGIGLSLVRELVELHGGGIRVDSEPGRGSRFTVTLAAGTAHLPREQVAEVDCVLKTSRESRAYVEEVLSWLPAESHVAAQPVDNESGVRRPRILLADDNVDLNRYLARLLEPHYEVLSVFDGQSALEEARAKLPDLILSDVMMPRLDGFGLLRQLRADERTRQLPIILLSARAGDEASAAGLDVGADDYLVKPFSARELLARVRAHLELKRRRGELERDLAQRVESRTAEVSRLTRVLQMLSGINAALLRIQDREEVLTEACRLAHVVGGYELAMVALKNLPTRTARPIAWAGCPALIRFDAQFKLTESESGDSSVIGRVIRTGESVLCESIEHSDLTIEHRDHLMDAGIHSLACIPLKVDDTPVGAFLFGARETEPLGPDQMLLLEELGANLSFALQYLNKHQEVEFLSYFEPLTGLPRRKLFYERLDRLLIDSHGGSARLLVLVFDITHLAVVNDSFGRHTGDRLLQMVGDRLKEQFDGSELLAHLGGGSFVCVRSLEAQGQAELSAAQATIRELFARPFHVDGREIAAEVRCGLAVFPEDGREPNELVQNAESALKEAKVCREPLLRHRLQMNSDLARRVDMEHRLRVALDNGEFRLYYQPKVTSGTGQIVGVEALLRWQDSEQRLISPAEFLPLLESAGLMPATSAWVLNRAVCDCREWRSKGLPPLRVAVNISPSELRRRQVARDILDAVGDLAGSGSWGIDVEITEGALSGDASSCVQSLRVLRAAGLRVAIDDFGTGFSSLARLSELPIDTLKIDQSFTRRLPSDLKNCTLVKSIIGLAQAFGMRTVAEGVESAEQLEYLARAGCDESQGYLHSRPLPKAAFEGWLLNQAQAVTRQSVSKTAGRGPD
ncbi:MAG: EAL domain-containing protein [Proteobacteria bacterium]|nr:EAL domain-containing protein [Pseudomonadota bacterium]